jgi:hypothetical protein
MCVFKQIGRDRRAMIGHPATVASGDGAAAPGTSEGARYLRVTRRHLYAARAGQDWCLVEEGLARSRSLPGCRGAGAGLDSESGALVVITWWDTREQAQGTGAGAPLGASDGVASELPEIYAVPPKPGS